MKRSRKKKTIGDFIWRLVFLAALVVFCYCAFQLVTIYLEYKKGTDEYSSLEQQYVTEDTISGTTENNTPSGTGDGTRTGSDGSEATDGTSETTGKVEGSGTAEDPYTTGETETEIETDAEGKTTVKAYPVLKNPVDFESLKKVNEDIIGWIRVNALDISYPIAQSTNNDYYLHRTFERVDNFAGCIFMEYQNHSDFSDKNTIIYGHNMKTGTIFGCLTEYKKAAYYQEHPYIEFDTLYGDAKYEVFAAFAIDVVQDTSFVYNQYVDMDEDTYSDYVAEVIRRSDVDSGIRPEYGEQLLTLSTCEYSSANGRYVVVARKVSS